MIFRRNSVLLEQTLHQINQLELLSLNYRTKLICLFVCLFSLGVVAATLEWDANCSPDTAGYKVYYGTNTLIRTNVVASYTDDCGVLQPTRTNIYHTSFTESIVLSGRTNTSLRITNLLPSITYYFAVTAFDTGGLESDFSDEVSYTPTNMVNNPSAPTGLELIKIEKIN